jgi:flagellar biosynthesis/type III secretory pathway M-ring protein FliF/YscJ
LLHTAIGTAEQLPQKEEKRRPTMGSILLVGLPILLVLLVLAALIYSLAKLISDTNTSEDVASDGSKQESFLKASILHMASRLGR